MNEEKIQTIINEAEYEMLAFDRTSKVVSEKLINALKQLALCNVSCQREQLLAWERWKIEKSNYPEYRTQEQMLRDYLSQ